MDSGSEKSSVSRLIGWLRGKGDSSDSTPTEQDRSPGSTGSHNEVTARTEGVASGTPDAPAETTPSHLPSEQASVPPNAASLDLDSAAESGKESSSSSADSSADATAPASQPPSPPQAPDSSAESAPAPSEATTSAPVEPGSTRGAPLTGSSLTDLGDVKENARRANYGRGNLETGALASAGSPAREEPELEQEPDAGDASVAEGREAATDQAGSSLDASEPGTLRDAEPAEPVAGQDPPPEQPAGLSAADLVAGASSNLTSAQETLANGSSRASAEPETVVAAADETSAEDDTSLSGQESELETADDSPVSTADNLGTTDTTDTELSLLSEAESDSVDPAAAFAAGLSATEPVMDAEPTPDEITEDEYDRRDAFDSVDSTGIFGLADSDSGDLDYLDEASRESFESTVDELPESTGLFGLRDEPSTDLGYLSASETERFSDEALTTSDVSISDDFDSSAGSSKEADSPASVLTDEPSGGTGAASEMAPESATGLVETSSASGEEPSGTDLSASAEIEAASVDPTATADPESLLSSDTEAPVNASIGDTGQSEPIEEDSAELQFTDSAPPPPADVDQTTTAVLDDDPGGSLGDSGDTSTTPSRTSTSQSTGTGERVKGVDGVCPPDYPIKGNASSKVYHVPGLLSYDKTKAEWCFPTEEDAVSFGYRAPGGHRNQVSGHAGGSSTSPAGLQHSTPDEPAPAPAVTDPPAANSTANGQPATPVTTAQHSAAADIAGADTEPQGRVAGDGTRTCPAGYPIKGNGGSMIYHVPGTSSYDATIPEWCFATEDDAISAGFRAPRRRG